MLDAAQLRQFLWHETDLGSLRPHFTLACARWRTLLCAVGLDSRVRASPSCTHRCE